MGTSKERDGFFGKYTEHFDDDGNKVGESKEHDGFFGKYTEHRDAEGNKSGESRDREGFFSDYTEHTNSNGNKVGESRDQDGFLGVYTEHTDSEGQKTGESRKRKGFFGNYTEHKGAFHPIHKQKNVEYMESSKTGDEDWSTESVYEQTEHYSATTNLGSKNQPTKKGDIDSLEKKVGIGKFFDSAIHVVIAILIFFASAIFAFFIVTASWKACGLFFDNIAYSTNPLEVIFRGMIAGTWGICNLFLVGGGILAPFISVTLYFSYKDYK